MSVAKFKALQEAKIDLSTLTILIGENGTGKSSIVHALSILRCSKGSSTIVTELPYANLGPLPGLVAAGNEATIKIEGTEITNGGANKAPSKYTCEVRFNTTGLSSYTTHIRVGAFEFDNYWTRYGAVNPPNPWPVADANFNLLPTNVIGRAFRLGGYSFLTAAVTDEENRERQYRAQMSYDSLEETSLAIDKDLDRFYVVPPLRGLTEFVYPFAQSPNQEIQFRTPNSQMQLAGNLKYWEENEKKISRFLSELVGAELEVKLESGPQVRVLNAKNSVNFVNEGFGSNQLLWVFERIVNSPEHSIIAVEEPETHLHPKAQFALGKVLSQIAVEERKRLILVSHSPHLLSGVLTAIKSKKISSTQVALYFFEKTPKGIIVKRSMIDEQGVVTEGLRGFMEAAASELIEYTSAGA